MQGAKRPSWARGAKGVQGGQGAGGRGARGPEQTFSFRLNFGLTAMYVLAPDLADLQGS